MNRRFGSLRAVQMLVLLAALALGVTPALAVHSDGYFQIEGDVCGGGPIPLSSTCVDTTGDDWDNLITCSGTLGNCVAVQGNAAEVPVFVFDPAPNSIFTGGGSKDELAIEQWQYKNGNVPDKDNLIEAFAAVYLPTSGPRANHKLLYFGANRDAVNGDAQIGFWFFRNTVSAPSPTNTAQSFVGTHAVGDILILSNFVQGGGTSNIQVFVVTAVAADGTPTLTQPFGPNTTNDNLVCAGPGNDAACAATNGAITAALDPQFLAKSGATLGNYPVVGFFEGGVDLTVVGQAIGIPGIGTECLASFLVETRSSQSLTAVLKDFTLGAFEKCQATITTEIHSATHAAITSATPGDVIHDLAIVTGQAGAPVPTGTVRFSFFDGVTECGTGTAVTEDVLIGGPNAETCPLSAPAGSVCVRSSTHTALPPGLVFSAQYLGDTSYPDGATLATCEILTVGQCESSIATHILRQTAGAGCASPPCDVTGVLIDLEDKATVGLKDQAVVTPAANAACSQTPTGKVTFEIFADGRCSGTADSSVEIDLVNGEALTDQINLDANTLSFRATYGGDTIYKPSSASSCEPVCAISDNPVATP